jgi:hypothetical protein
MQYAVLIYEQPGYNDAFSDEQRQQITGEYLAVREHPGFRGGGRLQPVETATTVRASDGETVVTDGPFADTKEVFGGYYFIEADDLDVVLEIAAKLPAARFGGAVEIRPMVELKH